MLTLNPGDIFADNYKLNRLIDTGGFSEVWEAEFLSAGNTVALKIYPKLDTEGVKNIEAEYKNQSDLSHSHLLIARYFGKYNGYPYLEMRYCGGGNASNKIGEMTERQLAKCLYQVSSALEYLHENGIVHQDVKPNNFLLDNSGNYNLCDLGLSLKVRTTIMKFTQAKSGNSNSISGLTPPAYRAPELYDRTSIGQQPVKATDVWALGASIYELASGEVPFGEFGGLLQLKNDDTPDLPSKYSPALNGIIKKCLSKETWDRPKASELCAWASKYLSSEDYGFTETIKTLTPALEPMKNGSTVPQGTALPIEEPKKNRKAFWLLLALIFLGGSVWGIYSFMNNNKGNSSNIPPKTDTTISQITKPLVDTPTKYVAAIETKNKIDSVKFVKPVKIGTETVVKPDDKKTEGEVTIDYPVLRPPLGDCPPTITKIIRKKNSFVVVFKMRDCLNNMSLYPPGDDMAFYVRTTDKQRTFNLIAISKSGTSIDVPSGGLLVTATFQKVDDDVDAVDIMEGKVKSIDPGVTFFNFKNVNIKK